MVSGEAVRTKRYLSYLVLLAMVGILSLGMITVGYLLGPREFVAEPLHNTVEALGALAALIMSWLLLQREKEERNAKLFLLAMGFLGMGLLDGLHSASGIGQRFFLLRSMASLVGGFWFALVWLPPNVSQKLPALRRTVMATVVLMSVGIGALSYVGPLARALIFFQNGRFTPLAVWLNLAAALLFALAAVNLVVDYARGGRMEVFLLSCVSAIFALAELMFPFVYGLVSQGVWWFWHLLRFSAYLLVLGYLYLDFQRRLADLRRVLAQRNKAQKDLRKAYEQLEVRVDERTQELADANEKLRAEIAEREIINKFDALLNQLSAVLHASLDAQESMDQVIAEAARGLGSKTAFIGMIEDDSWVVKHRFGEWDETVSRKHLTGDAPESRFFASTVGEPFISDDLQKDSRFPPSLRRRIGLRSCLIMPLIIKGEWVGEVGFVDLSSPRSHTSLEIDFVAKLASFISLAYESARIYADQRKIADTLQQAQLILPVRISGLSFGHFYHSAETEGAEVGGDFFDLFELEHGRVGVVIGDVSGKGLIAATLTSVVKDTIKAYAYQMNSPGEVLVKTNDLINKQTTVGQFVTVVFGILDIVKNELVFCCAGHLPPLVRRGSGQVELIRAHSPAIGVLARFEFSDAAIAIDPGDALVLYTDGVTEARRGDDLYGEERLSEQVGRIPSGLAVEQWPGLIYEDVARFSDSRLRDDLAILALRLEVDA